MARPLTTSKVGTISYARFFVLTSHDQVALPNGARQRHPNHPATTTSAEVAAAEDDRGHLVSGSGRLPFRVLHDPTVLGPGEPIGTWLVVVGALQDADDPGRLAAGDLGDAPDAQVPILGLGRQHVGSLARGRGVPRQAHDGRWGLGGRQGV